MLDLDVAVTDASVVDVGHLCPVTGINELNARLQAAVERLQEGSASTRSAPATSSP